MTENKEKYVLRMVRNENRQDIQARFGAFFGPWALLPIGCAGVFLPIAWFCTDLGMDVGWTLFFGTIPFLASLIFVQIFINDRYRSYPFDLVRWWKFKTLEHLYMKGWLDNPPNL